MIFLKANNEIGTVFKKVIKTMGENVTWQELFIINNNDLILVGKGKSLFFNFDTKRTGSSPVDVSVNTERAEDMADSQMLARVLNMTLYAFGKWGKIKGLKVEKDYAQLNNLFAVILKDLGIETAYTEEHFRFYKNGIQMTYEELIQAILEQEKAKAKEEQAKQEEAKEKEKEQRPGGQGTEQEEQKEKEYKMGLWHDMVWTSAKLNFAREQVTEAERKKLRLGHDFYLVNYKCPECGGKLHMAVYPPGREMRIETDEKGVYIARAYTCGSCMVFYTPKPKRLITEGEIFLLDFEDDKVAYEDYIEVMGKRGKRISNSNFNAYESEYHAKDQAEPKELDSDAKAAKSMTDQEVEELSDRVDSGFYTQRSVDRYRGAVEQERKKREQHRIKEQKQKSSAEAVQETVQEPAANSGKESKQEPVRESARESDLDPRKSIITKTSTGEKESSDTRGSSGGKEPSGGKDKSGGKETSRGKELSGVKEQVGMRGMDGTKETQRIVREKTPQVVTVRPEIRKITAVVKGTVEHPDSVEAGKEISRPASDLDPQAFLREVLSALQSEDHRRFEQSIEAFGATQLKELERLLRSDNTISATERERFEEWFDAAKTNAMRKNWQQKVEAGKGKNYAELERYLKELEGQRMEGLDVREFLDSLRDMRTKRGEQELKNLLSTLPPTLSQKQYAGYREKIEVYQDLDTSFAKEALEDRRRNGERREIEGILQKTRHKERKDYQDLLHTLKGMDFAKETVTPYLDQLTDQLRQMDESAIRVIIPYPERSTFPEGIAAYEEITKGDFLSDIKAKYLERIDKRLTQLKSDEWEQLVRKLEKDTAGLISDEARVYFCNRKKVEDGFGNDTEAILIQNALNTYATSRGKYEYPILVGDSTHSGNGKKGFVLTPDHLFFNGTLNSGVIRLEDVEEVFAEGGAIGKGIFVKFRNGEKEKLSNTLKLDKPGPFVRVLNNFVKYLKEKPESRELSYLAKEKHRVKCCYRCGFVFTEGTICPKCGAHNVE